MKKQKKTLLPVLTFILVISILSFSVFAGAAGSVPADQAASSASMRINLRIEGISENLFDGNADVPYTDKLSVKQALSYFDQQNSDISVTGADSGYITAVNGDTYGTFGGWDGWLFEVNGTPAAAGIDTTYLKSGDTVLLYYGDPFGKGMQYPIIDTSLLRNGILKFTSDDTVYDASGNAVTSTNPVVGAEVIWYFEGGSVKYTTDAGGRISIGKACLTEGNHKIQIGKKGAEAGGKFLPMVLRFEPDTSVSVGPASEQVIFNDVGISGWACDYIYYLANLGIVGGKTPTAFVPSGLITRAEAVKMLAAASGDDLGNTAASAGIFTDVAAGSWYAPHVGWAYEKGVTTGSGSSFNPSNNITRQDLAVMLARYAAYKNYSLPKLSAAKVFSDAASISGYAKTAVSDMQQAGIIGGKGDAFAPKSFATRQEAAKMIALLLQGMNK